MYFLLNRFEMNVNAVGVVVIGVAALLTVNSVANMSLTNIMNVLK